MYSKIKNNGFKNQLLSRKRIIIIVTLILIACILGTFIFKSNFSNQSIATDTAGVQLGQPRLNLDAPTKEEQNSGNEAKSKVIEDEKSRNTNPPQPGEQKRTVTPVVTYADHINPQAGGQVEVGAYVGGVFEDGGRCTLTLTRGSVSRSVQVQSQKNSNSVDCPVMIISRTELEVGTWQAIVSYESATSQGSSTARNVEVRERSAL